MTLDDLEKRARTVIDDHDAAGEVPQAEFRALRLARSLLAVLPVVRAAEAWRDAVESPDNKARLVMRGAQLVVAIDKMRKDQGK